MLESSEFTHEPRFFWQRRWGRRLVGSLLVILLLGSGLYFTLRLPLVEQIGGGLTLFTQTLRTRLEQIVTRYFGRDLLLRQRSQQMLHQLTGELDRLHWLDVESTTIAVTLEGNLQPLRNQQAEARVGLQQLAAAVQHHELRGATGQLLRPAQVQALVAEKLQTFAALQAQSALYQETAQLHAATAVRAEQLQSAARVRIANLEACLALFTATEQLAAQSGSDADAQWDVIRTALQAQLAQAEQITAARTTLEKRLNSAAVKLDAVDQLLLDSAEFAAQLQQLTAQ
ncbi:MAG: hypothetical protein U0350_38260 [Caldilineaceae bacterium]